MIGCIVLSPRFGCPMRGIRGHIVLPCPADPLSFCLRWNLGPGGLGVGADLHAASLEDHAQGAENRVAGTKHKHLALKPAVELAFPRTRKQSEKGPG